MTTFEIIILCTLIVVVPTLVSRLIFLILKRKHVSDEKLKHSLEELKSELDILLSGTNNLSTLQSPSPDEIKDMIKNRDLILTKLTLLLNLMSKKLAVPIVGHYFKDYFSPSNTIHVELLDVTNMENYDKNQYLYVEECVINLIEKNEMPSDIKKINKIYKYFKKLNVS